MVFRKIRNWWKEKKKNKLARLRLNNFFARSEERVQRKVMEHSKDFMVRQYEILSEEFGLSGNEIITLQRDKAFNAKEIIPEKIGKKAKVVLSRFAPFQWGQLRAHITILNEEQRQIIPRTEKKALKAFKERRKYALKFRKAKGKKKVPVRELLGGKQA